MVDSSFVRVSGHHLLSAAAEEQAEQRQQSKWVKNAQGILTRKLCVVFTSYNLECEHTWLTLLYKGPGGIEGCVSLMLQQ